LNAQQTRLKTILFLQNYISKILSAKHKLLQII